MEAVNSESLQQSINIEHLNRMTLDNNDCLSAINLGKNSWKFNSTTTDLLQFENNKATTEHIYNNNKKYNNNANNKKSYEEEAAAEEEEEEEKEHIKNDDDKNNKKLVVEAVDKNCVYERNHNELLHKIEDKCDKIIEKIFKKNCLNHIILNEQINHNKTTQLNINCENLQNNINDEVTEQCTTVTAKEEEEDEEQEEKTVDLVNNHLEIKEDDNKEEKDEEEEENAVEISNLLNDVPTTTTTTTNGEEMEETEEKKSPVELMVAKISAVKRLRSRSRCSSISSIASNYSTSSGNTPNLVIDHLVAAQQFSKRKPSRWSSSSDTEEPAAKQAHMDTSAADGHSSSSEQSSTSGDELNDDENKTEKCNVVVQQQSPLKIKIVQTPTPVKEKECHETLNTEISARPPSTEQTDNNDIKSTDQQLLSAQLAVSTEHLVENLITENQLAATSPSPVASIPPAPEINNRNNMKSRRYYKCASCRTLHESWNFFMHIYERHQRYICLYCIKLFSTAEKLSVHLEIKHDLEQDHFHSEEALRHYEHVECQAKYLMCCTCQHLFVDQEPFSNHDCNMYMRPCALCGQMGRHSNNCKAHPDATRRNNKIKAKPPPISNRQQATSNLNAIGAVTDCDKIVATMEGIQHQHQQQQQQQHKQQTFEQINEIMHLPLTVPIASTTPIDYNLQGNLFNQEQQQQQHQQNQEEKITEEVEDMGEEEEQEEGEELGGEEEEEGEEEIYIPPKLVVPKFKLRVPKEFQKSVDAVITSSEESENESDNISTGSEDEGTEVEQQIQQQPDEQQQQQESVEKNVEEKELEADLDLSDSIDSPTENCLNKSIDSDLDTTDSRKMFKEEWEQRLKESVKDMKMLNSKQEGEEEERGNEISMNGPAQNHWTPTPPASPKNATTTTIQQQQQQQENETTNNM